MTTQAPRILLQLDDEAIRWQYCAICGQQKQRVVRQEGRPDYGLCDACQSAFILEDGGQMRMLYGAISDTMPKTRAFALKQWRPYFEIRAQASQERADTEPDVLPSELKSQASPYGNYSTSQDAILDLEAQKSDMFYSHAKKLEPPPRRLRETGELPDLDELFKD